MDLLIVIIVIYFGSFRKNFRKKYRKKTQKVKILTKRMNLALTVCTKSLDTFRPYFVSRMEVTHKPFHKLPRQDTTNRLIGCMATFVTLPAQDT